MISIVNNSYLMSAYIPATLTDCALCLQMILHVISFAFLMVLASTFIMVPVLLYAFDLRHQGWYWQHAALFAAMASSTVSLTLGHYVTFLI